MKLWLDAQLPPLLAQWINEQEFGVTSFAVRDLGLRDASDAEIFRRARAESAVVMTKDRDFVHLLDENGPPPQLIWIRIGNCSNWTLQQVLDRTLPAALLHLNDGEPWVEIRPHHDSRDHG